MTTPTPNPAAEAQAAADLAARFDPARKGRICLFVDATMLHEGGYVPSVVREGESGHYPLTGAGVGASPWYWGHDLEKAKKIAADYNAQMGLSEDDARDIVLSSMFGGRP